MARSVRKIRLTGADQKARATACRLIGFSIRESAGVSSASALIYDNASAASGDVIPVTLAAGESTREWWAAAGEDVLPGVLMENGIFVDVGGTGTVEGVLFVLDGA